MARARGLLRAGARVTVKADHKTRANWALKNKVM
jgi:hypothetical protein